jgi:hypothetical protein
MHLHKMQLVVFCTKLRIFIFWTRAKKLYTDFAFGGHVTYCVVPVPGLAVTVPKVVQVEATRVLPWCNRTIVFFEMQEFHTTIR